MVSRLTKLKGILRGAFLFVHSIVRTAMQRVYRLETLEGVGVYTAREIHPMLTSILNEYVELPNHPGPFTDKGLKNIFFKCDELLAFNFGFSSLRQLKDWFFHREDRQLISECGIVCAVYEVEDEHFHLGERQCVFKKGHAKKVGQVAFI